MKYFSAIVMAFWLFIGFEAHAAELSEVEVGADVSDIQSLNDAGGSFGVNIMLWWKTRDATFDPFAGLEVLNARSWAISALTHHTLPDGTIYWSGFVAVTVNQAWSFKRYLFDTRRLQLGIQIKKAPADFKLKADNKNLVLGKFARIPGFDITGGDLSTSVASDDNSLGLTANAHSIHPRVTLRVDLAP